MQSLKTFGKIVLPILLFIFFQVNAGAQYLRTSYFMDASPFRIQVNPALTPMRGYVNIPVIGALNADIESPLEMSNIFDLIDGGTSFTSDKFIHRLHDVNDMNVSVNTDIFSVGWYRDRNFWSVSAGVHADIDATIPKSIFTFMRDMRGINSSVMDWTDWSTNIGGEKLDVYSYADVSLGFARAVTDRLTIGVRLKFLLGIGDAKLKVDDLGVETNLEGVPDDVDWSSLTEEQIENINGTARINVDASLQSTFKGLYFTRNADGYINNVDFSVNKLGIAGYGLSVDLGFAYKILDNLTVSAAVLDIGFLTWSKKATEYASSDADNLSFDSSKDGDIQRFADIVGSSSTVNFDMFGLKPDDSKREDRTTILSTTVSAGIEYTFCQNVLGVGLLYTGRITSIDMQNEVTLSFNYKPKNWVNLAVSYSPIQSLGQSFGFAAKLGPLFIGTDYMFFGSASTKNINAYLGICIPIGQRRYW